MQTQGRWAAAAAPRGVEGDVPLGATNTPTNALEELTPASARERLPAAADRSERQRPARAAAARPARALPPRLTRVANRWRLDLRDVANPAGLFTGAFLIPTGGGGFALRSLDRAGYLAAVGAQVGDRLIAVNDRLTLTADQVLDVLANERNSAAVSLRVSRGPVHYRISVELLR